MNFMNQEDRHEITLKSKGVLDLNLSCGVSREVSCQVVHERSKLGLFRSSTSTVANMIVVLDDDDEVQVTSPRSFAQAKAASNTESRHGEDDLLQLRLGPAGHLPASSSSSSRRRYHLQTKNRRRQRRPVLPENTIDLTSINDDCEVVVENPKKKMHVTPASEDQAPSKEVQLTCAICYDTMKEETSTICGHIFCKDCICSAIKVQKKCPTCRKKLTTGMVHRIYLGGSTK